MPRKRVPQKPSIAVRSLSVDFSSDMIFEEGTRVEITVVAIVRQQPDVMVKSVEVLPMLASREV